MVRRSEPAGRADAPSSTGKPRSASATGSGLQQQKSSTTTREPAGAGRAHGALRSAAGRAGGASGDSAPARVSSACPACRISLRAGRRSRSAMAFAPPKEREVGHALQRAVDRDPRWPALPRSKRETRTGVRDRRRASRGGHGPEGGVTSSKPIRGGAAPNRQSRRATVSRGRDEGPMSNSGRR